MPKMALSFPHPNVFTSAKLVFVVGGWPCPHANNSSRFAGSRRIIQLSFFFSFSIHFACLAKRKDKQLDKGGKWERMHMHPLPGFALVIAQIF